MSRSRPKARLAELASVAGASLREGSLGRAASVMQATTLATSAMGGIAAVVVRRAGDRSGSEAVTAAGSAEQSLSANSGHQPFQGAN